MIIDSCVVFDIKSVVAAKGDLTFRAAPDHGNATNYQVRVYAGGTTTPVVARQDLLVPKPNDIGMITVNLQALLNPLSPGNYDVAVAVTTPGGTTESAASNVFTVPLV